MKARQEKYLPQAGTGEAVESRPLTVSAGRGCPSYSGGGDVLLKCDTPFARSGLLQRTPPKTTTQAWTRTETEQTETEDGVSTGDEGAQCRRTPYASPFTFFSPMASTPRNRGEGKRKKSPTSNKETETLEEKEERLLSGLFDSIVTINSLVDRQGPYKNTANEVKTKLRELQKLAGRVRDVRRMRAEKKDGESERTPKRAKKAATVEEKGTNTSTGGEMEGLEWDDDLGTETDWKEVKKKGKRQRRKEKNRSEEREGFSKVTKQAKEKGKSLEKDIPVKMKKNMETPHKPIQKGKKKGKRKTPMAKPEEA